jgi:hypothetical protein
VILSTLNERVEHGNPNVSELEDGKSRRRVAGHCLAVWALELMRICGAVGARPLPIPKGGAIGSLHQPVPFGHIALSRCPLSECVWFLALCCMLCASFRVQNHIDDRLHKQALAKQQDLVAGLYRLDLTALEKEANDHDRIAVGDCHVPCRSQLQQ